MKYLNFKLLFFFAALALAASPAWAETVTLTLSDFPDLSGSYSSGSITKDDITYEYTDFIKSNGNIQTKANSGAIYNTTAYPGDIQSVSITHSSTARATTILGSSDGSNWEQVATGSGSITGDFSGKGYKYFKITRGSNAAYWVKIEITYGSGGDTPQPQDVTLEFPQSSYEATIGETFNAPELTVTPSAAASAVRYSSSNETVATVDEESGAVTLVSAGTTRITASISDNATYNDASDYYDLTVKAGSQPGGVVYELLTNLNQLQNGKKVIIANKNESGAQKAMGPQQSNNFSETDVTITSGLTITAPSADVQILTLEGTTGEWYFKTSDNKYLYAASTSKNYLRTESPATDNAKATIVLDSEGNSVITFQGSNTHNLLRYNSGSSLFSCYESGQQPVYLYVQSDGGSTVEQVATPTFNPVGGTYNSIQTVTIACETAEAAISYKIGDGEYQAYTEPITVAESMTITAMATKAGMLDSEEAVAAYVINLPTLDAPTFEPAQGEYNNDLDVTISAAEGAKVYYIIGEGETWTEYTEAISVNGNTTIKAKAEKDGYNPSAEATASYTFVVAPLTINPAAGTYNSIQTVTIATETQGAAIEYSTDGENWKAYTEAITVGENMTIQARATKAGYATAEASAEYVIDLPVQIAAPTFMPGSGHYTEAKEVAIACATPGVSISYKIGDGEFQPYTKPFVVDHSCTVTAKVTKDGRTIWTDNEARATYTINTLNPVEITDGYYQIMNKGNEKYAHVQGRKTMTFTNDIDQKAGTVIRVETMENGQVKVLRSQAADLQGYADRAMRYVPEVVQMVANKLHAEGVGELLGHEGLDAIMEKFNECFDYHLYVEGSLDNCRIYGKTPSMQPVVDFYNENQSKVDDKLPMLEGFINDAINKVLEKTNGQGSSILVPFSLQTIWERMGGQLTKPVDEESTMAFYHQILTNKQYVWEFAYQTATFYLEKVKNHPRYEEMKEKMGEFANYIDKLEQIRPDTKYFIVQENGKVDYISEGNADIINNDPKTFWDVQPRATFSVDFPAANRLGLEYATTLYTDFAYAVPKGVTAYKVTGINEQGVAQLEALTSNVPAQTPVLLKALTSGPKTLTLDINNGTALTGNRLVGPDYLINEYQIRTPQVESVFDLVKDVFGESFYNNNVAKYEHLMLKNAGTVNNKYFWGLTNADIQKCTFTNDEGSLDCVIRTLSDGDQHLGFYNNWEAKTNQALLVNQEFDPIKLAIKGDVTRDGLVNVSDVVALVNIISLSPAEPKEFHTMYDYIAADFNENGIINISDATALIQYLLNMGVVPIGDDE